MPLPRSRASSPHSPTVDLRLMHISCTRTEPSLMPHTGPSTIWPMGVTNSWMITCSLTMTMMIPWKTLCRSQSIKSSHRVPHRWSLKDLLQGRVICAPTRWSSHLMTSVIGIFVFSEQSMPFERWMHTKMWMRIRSGSSRTTGLLSTWHKTFTTMHVPMERSLSLSTTCTIRRRVFSPQMMLEPVVKSTSFTISSSNSVQHRRQGSLKMMPTQPRLLLTN
mmetsp:Transcript_2419/g.7692  ORF Transcript_2419/g.7692 Transcript_2419/m.7692 type:complete len:220 (-) Transcript_2419:1716-2375(-)